MLSESNTVYAIDLLGFGASDKPPGFSYTMETWAEVSHGLILLLANNRAWRFLLADVLSTS